MILEVAMLNIRPGDSADFARALAEAQGMRCQRIGSESTDVSCQRSSAGGLTFVNKLFIIYL
jgi:hypothetical protein